MWKGERQRHSNSAKGIRTKNILNNYVVPKPKDMSSPDDEFVENGKLYIRMRSTDDLSKANKFKEMYEKLGCDVFVRFRQPPSKARTDFRDISKYGVYVRHIPIQQGKFFSLQMYECGLK